MARQAGLDLLDIEIVNEKRTFDMDFAPGSFIAGAFPFEGQQETVVFLPQDFER
jgi:hypothetical protein